MNVLIALLGAAWAAVPFELPPGEAPAEWSVALGLAGFAPGALGGGPGAALVRDAAGWRLVIRDTAGGERSVPVEPPRTAREREDLAWMAQSLLDPSFGRLQAEPPPAPAAPPPPPSVAPPRSAPAPVAPPPQPPPPVAAPPQEEAPTPSPPEPVAVELPVEEPKPPPRPDGSLEVLATLDPPPNAGARARWQARVGSGARVRGAVGPAPILDAGVATLRGPWTLEGGVRLVGTAPMRLDGAEATVSALRVGLAAGYASADRIGPRVVAGAGDTLYRFEQAGVSAASGWFPSVWLEAGLVMALAPRVRLETSGRALAELRALDVSVNEVPQGAWSFWSFEPACVLTVDFRDRNASDGT